MLNENLRNIRTSKGLTQEELADKLGVVRQTISKWEKGLSIPDSEMLIRISAELNTPVSVFLGETVMANDYAEVDDHAEVAVIAEKLERLNEQLAKRNKIRRIHWMCFFIILGIISAGTLMSTILACLHHQFMMQNISANPSAIGGADGPTSILVSWSLEIVTAIISLLVLAVAVVGVYKTRKRK